MDAEREEPPASSERGDDAVAAVAATVSAREPSLQGTFALIEAVRDPGGEVVDWVVRSVDDGWLALSGTTREAAIGNTLGALLGSAVKARWHGPYVGVLTTGESLRYELTSRGRRLVTSVGRVDGSRLAVSTIEMYSYQRALADRDLLLHEMLEARRERIAELEGMRRLHALATRAVHEDDVEALLHEVVDVALAVAGTEIADLQRLEGAPTPLLVLVASRGVDAAFREHFARVPAGPSCVCGLALECGERVIVEDMDLSAEAWNERDAAVLRAHGVRASVATPLKSRSGKTLGMLTTHHRAPHRPSEGELRLLDLLARLGADVIERDEQRRAMAQMRDARRRIDEFLLSVADPVVIVNREGRIEYSNAQAAAVFGYARDELNGMDHEALVPARFRGVHRRHYAGYFGEPRFRPMGNGMPLMAVRRDGTEFPVEVSLNPVETGDGIMVSTVVRDVTERQRMEASLKVHMERLTSAIESVPDPFAIWDAQGRLSSCNSAYRSMLASVFPGDPVGHTFHELSDALRELIVFEGRPEGERFLDEREARVRDSDAFEFTLRDGRTLRVLRRPTPEGGSVGIATDLTDDLRRERELLHARHEAEAASRAKSDFLASMSHELRTPLNAILGFCELLQRDKRDKLTDRQRQMVQHVFKGGEHLLHLIDDVLDLARIEARGVSVSPAPVDVADTLRDVVVSLAPGARVAGVTLHVDEHVADVPTIEADPRRFLQVLMNFGSNAVKYNRPGGAVTFSAALVRPGTVRVTVADTGIGVPLDQQARLFQPFHRAGQEAGPIEGTGIGLSIAQRLAAMMRGAIGFESTPGEGSTFWVEMPVYTRSVRPEREAPALTPLPSPLAGVRPSRVLYVEDNAASVALLRSVLAGAGNLELLDAPTGEAGVALAHQRLPDAIIMDINLPGMSGFEALSALRASPATAGIPVIALSASATEADRVRGETAGFARYLTKPVKLTELEAALALLLTRPAR